MKIWHLSFIFILLSNVSFANIDKTDKIKKQYWLTSLEEGKKIAHKTKRDILLVFSAYSW